LAYVTNLFYPGPSRPTDTVLAAIEELGLSDVLDARAEELSYGRRRLVAIARAVATRPSILLLDEPAAGLDEEESREVGHLIRRLADDWGIGVLLIEHDVPMVLRTADRVHVLDFGRTIAAGTPDEIRSDEAVRAAYLGEPVAAEEDAADVIRQ
jgi:sulfate-transporting ATPase